MPLFAWPPKNPEKRLAFQKAFQELWVAGTLGAFFTAFARNLPVHLREISRHFDTDYTIDRFVRYGYLLWLLAYFLISNLQNRQSKTLKKWDITYDVVQSACALAAAFFLGFVVPCEGCTLRLAYGFTNTAIFVICSLSLIWFRSEQPAGINGLRITGAVISFVSILLALVSLPQTKVLLMFGGFQVALWIVLLAYIRIRVDAPNTTFNAP